MALSVFDTNFLIRHWWESRGASLAGKTPNDARGWAKRLLELQETDAAVTPVVLEFLCGFTDRNEMALGRAFVETFVNIDRGNITPADWTLARQMAERIPREPKRRNLGDCLIRAIASRLRHDVISLDEGMPRTPSTKSPPRKRSTRRKPS